MFDEITLQLLSIIRKYETENDTNIDPVISFGHYSNELSLFSPICGRTMTVVINDESSDEYLIGLTNYLLTGN